MEIVSNLDFDEFSGIVVSGGDGTINEVVSAMKTRKD